MKIKNLFWGIFFIVAAIVIVISSLGYLPGINLFSLILTILLIPVIVKSAVHLNFGGILFPMALLCIIFAEPLGITNLTPWPVLGVALFGTVGLHMIFGGPKYGKSYVNEEHFEEIIDTPDNSIVSFSVKCGSSIKYVNSESFQKANIKASCAGLKVYFDRSTIHPDGAQIDLDISLSGVELYIPREWNIVNKSSVSLGAIEEKNNRKDVDGPTVAITGNVSLSGVEIIYV